MLQLFEVVLHGIACPLHAMSDIQSYFVKKSIKTTEKSPAGIPDPCGPLSSDVPSSSMHN